MRGRSFRWTDRWTELLAVVILCAWSNMVWAAEPSPQEQLEQKLAEVDRLQAEIAALREATRTPQSILVNVEMLEVNLTKLRELGVDFAVATQDGFVSRNVADSLATEGVHRLGVLAPAGFLDALKRNNVAKTIASPCVAVVSGKPASLSVGGRFPVPAAPGADAAVEFQEFGTRLDLLAKSLGNNQVRLSIHPRVSEIDDSRTIEVHGRRVPALKVQECETFCEAAFGETVLLSGLVTQRIEAIKRFNGPVEERVQEIALCVVVRAEDASKLAPLEAQVDEAQVSAAPYDAPR